MAKNEMWEIFFQCRLMLHGYILKWTGLILFRFIVMHCLISFSCIVKTQSCIVQLSSEISAPVDVLSHISVLKASASLMMMFCASIQNHLRDNCDAAKNWFPLPPKVSFIFFTNYQIDNPWVRLSDYWWCSVQNCDTWITGLISVNCREVYNIQYVRNMRRNIKCAAHREAGFPTVLKCFGTVIAQPWPIFSY